MKRFFVSLILLAGCTAAESPEPEPAIAAAPDTATAPDRDDHGECTTREAAADTARDAPAADPTLRRGAAAKADLVAPVATWTAPPVAADVIARQQQYLAAADALAATYPDDPAALARARAELKAAMLR